MSLSYRGLPLLMDGGKEWRYPSGDDETGGHHAGFPWARVQLEAAQQMIALVPRNCRFTAVQAGGNVGHMAWAFAQHFVNVITFEPDPQNYECLLANLNGLTNVRAVNMALGAEVGTQRLTHNRLNSGASFLTSDVQQATLSQQIIPVMPLDYLPLQACDLLQLDVEGFELAALHGAKDTIRLHQPTIVLEINVCASRYGYCKGDLDKLLTSWDYVEVRSHRIGNDHVYKHRSEI